NLNSFYSKLDPPTLKAENYNQIPFFSDSKIRFKLEEIKFYVDSTSWLRWSQELNMSGKFPLKIEVVDSKNNIIGFVGVGPAPFKKNIDSIIIFNSTHNNGGYKIDSTWQERTDVNGKTRN